MKLKTLSIVALSLVFGGAVMNDSKALGFSCHAEEAELATASYALSLDPTNDSLNIAEQNANAVYVACLARQAAVFNGEN